MTSPAEEAAQLFEEARSFPIYDKTRTSLLASAARAADAAQDRPFAYRIRFDLVESALLGCGEITRGLAAFAWCLDCHDRDPSVGSLSQLHWRYKWVVDWAESFVEISRPQLFEMLADAERRFATRGLGAGAVARMRADVHAWLGDKEEALRFHERWKITSRDSLSNCHACELDSEVAMFLEIGRAEEGLRKAEELFAKGRSCIEVPALTYAAILPALHEQGRGELAERYHRLGLAKMKQVAEKRIGHLMGHFLHLAVTGQTGRGLRILRRSLAAAAEHPAARSRLKYLVGAGVLFERIGREQATLKIAWPEAFGGDGKVRPHAVQDLLALVEKASTSLVQAFDGRNGNDHASRRVREWEAFRGYAVTLAQKTEEGSPPGE